MGYDTPAVVLEPCPLGVFTGCTKVNSDGECITRQPVKVKEANEIKLCAYSSVPPPVKEIKERPAKTGPWAKKRRELRSYL